MSFDLLKKHCRTHQPLGHEETMGLISKAQKGDIKSRNKVIEHNISFIIGLLRKYAWAYRDVEDLVQEGVIGMIRGIELFDTKSGYAFTTYLQSWVTQSMGRYTINNNGMIRIPNYVVEIQRRFNKLKGCDSRRNDDFFIRLIAKEKGIHPDTVRIAIKSAKTYTYIDDEEVRQQLEVIADPNIHDVELLNLSKIRKCLSDRQWGIIKLRMEGYTLEHCGLELSISRERARQIQNVAIMKLRALLGETKSGTLA